MHKISEFKETHFLVTHLENVLLEVNDSFIPSLDERIIKRSNAKSFASYINKVLNHGHLLIHHDYEKIHGLIVFYANDYLTGEAYISLLAVRNEFQGEGIGKNLLKNAISYIAGTGMNKIIVKTWYENIAALELYQKNGFEIHESKDKDVILIRGLADFENKKNEF